MQNVPFSVITLFAATTLLTVWLFYRAAGRSKLVLFTLLGWMALVSIPAVAGFFLNTHTLPPRMLLLVGPGLLTIAILFFTRRGRQFLDGLDVSQLTLLHIVRVPVELTLFSLFMAKMIPQIMTFEGWNFDIISGLTAPVVYWLVFRWKVLGRKTLIAWNLLCLALVLNIVGIAILAVPTPFQQIAFEQPNTGVLYFPFVWLPGIVVPLVILSHLAALRLTINSIDSIYD